MKSSRTVQALAVAALLALAACKTTTSSSLKDEGDGTPGAAPANGDMPTYTGPAIPDGYAPAGDNRQEWLKYCAGGEDVADKPMPNYGNDDVKQAVAKINTMFDHSLAINIGAYKTILAKYATPMPPSPPYEVKQNAHSYISYLCGEFRDRASLIGAKLRWIGRMNFVTNLQQGETFDVKSDRVWEQVRIEDYNPYLVFSNALWTERANSLQPITIGNIQGIDRPVPGLSVCETKMIFSEFVRKGVQYPGLDQYNQTYQTFQSQCNDGDQDFYYDFRGDSNLKPNTPESNGMIWFSMTMAFGCKDTKTANATSGLTDADCLKYYTNPFKSRWDAARAGLSAELLHTSTFRTTMTAQRSKEVTLVTSATAQDGYRFGDKGPWRFRVNDPVTGTPDSYKISARTGAAGAILDGWKPYWADPDFGLTKLYTGDTQKQELATLLRVAVDRHTYWYRTGYDDGAKLPLRGGAWSPFVASSYEMSKSNLFTSPGYTVQSSDPTAAQVKHWMFIFKVPKARMYNTDRLANEDTTTIDFDHYWFDERAFGNDPLAQDERAWDRLGEPLEDEYESVLYLHNIPSGQDQGESDQETPPHL